MSYNNINAEEQARELALWKAEEQHKQDLYWALRTRVLTEDELQLVRRYDFSLCIRYKPGGVSYKEAEKQLEFNQALYNQALLQIAALKAGTYKLVKTDEVE